MFVCKECGAQSAKWMGKCNDCNVWNSFIEQEDAPRSKKKSNVSSGLGDGFSSDFSYSGGGTPALVATPISEIIPKNTERISTGSAEFDRVLGGGLLEGSVVLLGGEPGIGKSTLLLQSASSFAEKYATDTAKKVAVDNSGAKVNNKTSHKLDETASMTTHIPPTHTSRVLYLCTEESQEQVAQRAKRIGLKNQDVLLSSEYRIEYVAQLVHQHRPRCIIIDSIQALRSQELGYMSGQGAHIRNCAAICCEWSQQYNAIVIIVAHITKEGNIAGPKLIEHMVDTVLMFEKAKHDLRFLYAQKNRHGAVDEVGVLQMTEDGLKDITDIGLFFLEDRAGQCPPGVCVAATFEGTRSFLVEIQSLTVPAISNNRVYSDRIDPRQVSRISAVLERHLKLALTNQNIYVNVAGGIRISEPGLELALALSLYSTYQKISMPAKYCAIGEISLPGEVHSVEHFSQRCRQAHEYGFTHIIAPKRNVKELNNPPPVQFIAINHIEEAIAAIKTGQ